MDSPLIVTYYDMSVILNNGAYLFQKLFVDFKVSKNVFLEKKSVSTIVRSSLNEGFEQINKKNISNYLLKLSSLRTFEGLRTYQ